MTKRDALLALSSALNDLIFLLRLDTKCPWTLKFEADCVTANELLENGFSDDELMQLVVSIKYVYQGMGSFNDYSPGIYNTSTRRYDAIPGTENYEAISQRVFDSANKLQEQSAQSGTGTQ